MTTTLSREFMFKKIIRTSTAALIASSLIMGCATSKDKTTSEKSANNTSAAATASEAIPKGGFLGKNYARLQPATSPSGQPTVRWINPSLKIANYDRILLETPMVANADNYTSKELVTEIKGAMKTEMGTKLQGIFGITTKVHPRTLRLRTAISSIDAKEIVSPTAIPLSLLANDATPVLDVNSNFIIFVQYELTDATTGELMGVGIRRNDSSKLPQGQAKIGISQIEPIINSWAHDARLFFKKS
jgi:hypothetical protein